MRALVLAALVAAFGPVIANVPAHAAVDQPVGAGCRFERATEPAADTGMRTGELSGGPLVLVDSTTHLPGAGTLTCRVQANVGDHTGTGGASISAHGRLVVLTPPVQVTIVATYADNVYVCTAFTDDSDGTTYYFDDEAQRWSTDPGVACDLVIEATPDDEPGPFQQRVDAIVCPLLAVVFPPEGDVAAVWDCPPYDNA